MKRPFVAALVLLAVHAGASGAQPHVRSHTAAQHDSLAEKYLGTWEGSMTSPHGAAEGLKLVVARDSTGMLTATMTFPPGQPMATSVLEEMKATADRLTWSQELGPMTCKGSAALIGGTLRGETDCGHVSMAFLLNRK